MLNLFGEEVREPLPEPMGKRKPTVPKGYAAAPGSGPEGETCASCKHYTLKRMGGTYRKCSLMRAVWTGGPGSDIRARAPACKKWEASE
jgi:hypothetical protein